jgi:hypothetical protein
VPTTWCGKRVFPAACYLNAIGLPRQAQDTHGKPLSTQGVFLQVNGVYVCENNHTENTILKSWGGFKVLILLRVTKQAPNF